MVDGSRARSAVTELLSVRDRNVLAELEHALSHIGSPPSGSAVMAHLQTLTKAAMVTSWRFVHEQGRAVIDDVTIVGPMALPRRGIVELVNSVRAGTIGFLFSSPVPEVAQRNHVMELPSIRSAIRLDHRRTRGLGITRSAKRAIQPGVDEAIRFYDRYGVADLGQMRILLCDGPLLLRYLSIVQSTAFTTRQRRVFGCGARLVHRRAVLDHRLAMAGADRAALDVLCEAIGRAAFVVDRHGLVHYANALGRGLLDQDGSVRHTIAGAVVGQPSEFDVHPIRESGVPLRYVVIRRRAELAHVAAAVAAELGLGERATEVLVCASTGESTKSIASRLGVATNTVEFHLTNIFRRLGLGSRVELHGTLSARALGNKHK
jgi:DNA-binding CsgD family transcriptional regulator